MNGDWITDIVIGLVETYETNDVYLLCDYLNIELVHTYDIARNKSYFMRNENGEEFIFVRKGLDYKEERSLIAHELGHAILHTWLNVSFYCMPLCNRGQLELQADRFAAELLLLGTRLDDLEWESATVEAFANEIEVAGDLIELKKERSC